MDNCWLPLALYDIFRHHPVFIYIISNLKYCVTPPFDLNVNMRYLTAGMYLLSAVIQLISYGVIYNLDKKTLAQMEKDLGKRRDDAKADLSKIIGGED